MIWKNLLILDRVLFWTMLVLLVLGLFGKVTTDRPLKTGVDGSIRLRLNGTGIAALALFVTWIPTLIRTTFHNPWVTVLDKLANLVPLGVAVFGLVELVVLAPGTIVISDEHLEQIHWLKGNKRIPWSDIQEIDSAPKDRSVKITAGNGISITHSYFFSGRSRLLLAIKQHCASELPPDFPREPVSESSNTWSLFQK